jgi:hypothetical protein
MKYLPQERYQKLFWDYELEKTFFTRIILSNEAIFIHSSYADFGCWGSDI